MKKTILGIFLAVLLFGLVPSVTAQQNTIGDQWNNLNNLLKDAEVAETKEIALEKLSEAKSIYDSVFRSAAQEVDKESDDLITDAFVNIEKFLQEGNIVEAGLYRQVIDKTIYKIGFMKIEQALDKKDVQSLMDWFTIMEKKFKISEKPSLVTNTALIEIQKSIDNISKYSVTIRNELLEFFKLKTIEELEEGIAALNEGKINDARKFAFEGLYYYRTLHPSVIDKLGMEKADELLDEMEEAVEVTSSNLSADEMKDELEQILQEVELIVREYEGGDTSEVGIALAGIKDRLVLVDEEYKDAVVDGKIINPVEYDETVVFLSRATEIFNSNKAVLRNLSEMDAALLETNFARMDKTIKSLGEYSIVKTLVGESLIAVNNLTTQYGGSIELDPLAYIERIEELLVQTAYHYREGRTDMALSLATQAYLDNYEFIEADIAYHDKELMEKIEIMLREELRAMIKNGESPDKVDAHINAIKQELGVAETIIPEFGSMALVVLVAGITAIIVFGMKTQKLSLVPKL